MTKSSARAVYPLFSASDTLGFDFFLTGASTLAQSAEHCDEYALSADAKEYIGFPRRKFTRLCKSTSQALRVARERVSGG